MDYIVRKAAAKDLKRIEEIYAYARAFMVETGNPHQWGQNHPPREQLVLDMGEENLYVLENETGIHGVFFFLIGDDPTYAAIDGAWHSDTSYGTIHRIAGDGSGGILAAAVAFAKQRIDHIRIDTHEDNKVMQRALAKQGFRRCGIIHIADGSPRIAYDLVLKLERGNAMIREAVYEDLGQILEIYLFLHETIVPEETDHLLQTWSQILADPNHHLIVCEVDKKIVSSCVCVIIPNLTRNVRPYAFVENVVTHEAYRGKGYATECLSYAKQLAEKRNCYKMMLLTGSKKESTLRFYENAGYNSSDKTAFIQWLNR